MFNNIILIAFISNFALTEKAYFEITKTNTHEKFIVLLVNPDTIQHARRLLEGSTQERQNIYGKIIKSRASYNPNWSYHLDPVSIHFADISIEQCSSTAADIEQRITQYGETGTIKDIWCPYPSMPTQE